MESVGLMLLRKGKGREGKGREGKEGKGHLEALEITREAGH